MNEIKKYNDIHAKIIELKKDIENSFLKIGAMLKLVRDEKLYLECGCVTFEEYIAQPELSLSRGTVYAIINVLETFFVSGQPDKDLIEIGYTKLNRISQFKNDEDFDEWVYKAKTLSLSDLGEEIREVKGTEARPKQPTEVTCPKCGYKFGVM